MITIGIVLSIGIVLGIKMAIRDKDSEPIGCLFFVFLIIGAIIAVCIPNDTKDIKRVIYLESLQDNVGVSGNFVLGSGTVNDVWKYSYYVKRGGSYYLEQINANGVPIKFTNSRARIEWVEEVRTDAFINKWSIQDCETYRKTIYIPKGSIKQNYNLDAR